MSDAPTFLAVMKWTDDECRAYLERRRWPDGPVCPKCGAKEPYTVTRKSPSKNVVRSFYKCRACKRQFTATVGTIFEDSHIPLSKWFAAIYLMVSSKKGISAHQLHRELQITYRAAWFMCHRVREAMKDGEFTLLTGTIEADETYVGGRQRGHPVERERVRDEIKMGLRPNDPHPRSEKAVVFGMVERGGRVRTKHVPDATAGTLRPLLTENIDLPNAHLITDAHPAYRLIRDHLPHDVIRHDSEYVRGEIHTQNIEGYWSILKRGLYGVFHHVDAGYLPCYLSEFEFRFNRRKVSDAAAGESARLGARVSISIACSKVSGASETVVSSCLRLRSFVITRPARGQTRARRSRFPPCGPEAPGCFVTGVAPPRSRHC